MNERKEDIDGGSLIMKFTLTDLPFQQYDTTDTSVARYQALDDDAFPLLLCFAEPLSLSLSLLFYFGAAAGGGGGGGGSSGVILVGCSRVGISVFFFML